MKEIRRKILNWLSERRNQNLLLHLFILAVIFFVVALVNFPRNSWYTGWDNLHPEFDFFLNFKRGLAAVWQENQGLGTIGGHGYAATLPHTIFLYLMSFLLPLKYLRSTFTFIMLATGALGGFFFTRLALEDRHENLKNKAALVAGLFYMLNFATVQQFYIQLEAFIIHFAALPWTIWAILRFLKNKNRKNLMLLAGISLASSAQGFIPPLFIATLIMVSFILFFYLAENFSFARFKDIFIIGLVLFCMNAYWLLPNLYYAATRSSTYLNSYNNISSTEDFILKSKKYGKIANVILMESSITESIDVSDKGEIFPIFMKWTEHLNSRAVLFAAAFLFLFKIIGALNFIKSKKYYLYALFASLIFLFSLLASDSLPLIYNLFQKIPILRQSFRIPFTKFSFALAFSYSIALGAGSYAVLNLLSKFRAGLVNILTVLLIGAIIFFAYPIFSGNLFYARTKIDIPKSYFDLFDFFKDKDKKTRIANLPQGWSWGWSIYSWGYSGSGFLWYGLEQPVMDRAFDVWGAQNEQYYWELTHAIYSENFALVDKIFDKYQIRWLIFDGNILSYPNVKSYLYAGRLQKYLDGSSKYRLVKVISSQEPNVHPINIYQVELEAPAEDFKKIVDLSKMKNIGPEYKFTHLDQATVDYGEYYSNTTKPYDAYYPFRALFSAKSVHPEESNIEETSGHIFLKGTAPKNLDQYDFISTPAAEEESPAGFYLSGDRDNPGLVTDIPLDRLKTYYDSASDANFLHHESRNCGIGQSHNFSQEEIDGKILRFSSTDSETCFDIIFADLPQSQSYLVEIENRNVAGRRLSFALINHNSKKSDFDLTLTNSREFEKNFLIIPALNSNAVGISLHFNNMSIGRETAINDIKSVKIMSLPYEFLKSAKFIKKPGQNKKISADEMLIYYQAYDTGWHAYKIKNSELRIKNLLNKYFPFLFGEEIKDHILVNNWANGWLIGINNTTMKQFNNETIEIIFLPQYLEFIGFGLLGIAIIWMTKR